jgi:hypothetical protein
LRISPDVRGGTDGASGTDIGGVNKEVVNENRSTR